MSAPAKLRVGVIGTGFGARVVAPVFRETEGCAVVDVISARDERAASALCAREDVDLISVQAPPFLHRKYVSRAIEAGRRAVLCEKPFGRHLEDAQAMRSLAEQAGVLHFVNFEFRRHPARRELRRLVREGIAGEIEHVQWSAFHGVWLDPSRPFGWSFDRELGGGWIRLSGSHTFDYMRWTLGEIADATGTVRTTVRERADRDGRMRRCTAEDGYTALLRTARGTSIAIDATSTSPVERPNRVTVIGSEGVLELINDNPREEDARITLHTRGGEKELFRFQQSDTYTAQMREWAGILRDSVRRGAPDPDAPTFADGLACSRVMDLLARRARPAGDPLEEPR